AEFKEAIRLDPTLGARTPISSTTPWLQYNAACAAALAGCGVGKDADKLDDKEKAQLRGEGLGWLQADLLLYAKQLATGNPADAAAVQFRLRCWLADADCAVVRGPEALAKLPEAERQPWQKLWNDVADLLKRAPALGVTAGKDDPEYARESASRLLKDGTLPA